jgi:hypothetical protein
MRRPPDAIFAVYCLGLEATVVLAQSGGIDFVWQNSFLSRARGWFAILPFLTDVRGVAPDVVVTVVVPAVVVVS